MIIMIPSTRKLQHPPNKTIDIQEDQGSQNFQDQLVKPRPSNKDLIIKRANSNMGPH